MRKIISLIAAGAATWAVLGLTASAQPGPQGLVLQLRPETSPEITPLQRGQIQILRKARGIGVINVAQMSPQLLRTTGVGKSIQLTVEPNVTFASRAVAVETLQGGMLLWRGEVTAQSKEMPPGLATFVVNGDQITGSIHAPNGDLYQVRPLGGGGTAIVKVDYAAMPLDDPPGDAPKAASPRLESGPAIVSPRLGAAVAAGKSAPAAADSGLARINPAIAQLNARQFAPSERIRCIPCILGPLTPTIDVLVAYTPSAQTAAGDINGLITLAITETNDSFSLSGINAKLRLVGTMPVTYNEAGRTFEDMVAQFAGTSDGFMDKVHAQRNAVHADVAVLIINNDAWCGRADDIGATAPTAFVIVHYSCATGYYSFGHEIGHLMGARHDMDDDSTLTPFAYGHGFRHPASGGNGWRTIMSYACSSHQCDPRLQYWSSPNLTHNGLAMGTAAREHNVRVWNERAATVAGFR